MAYLEAQSPEKERAFAGTVGCASFTALWEVHAQSPQDAVQVRNLQVQAECQEVQPHGLEPELGPAVSAGLGPPAWSGTPAPSDNRGRRICFAGSPSGPSENRARTAVRAPGVGSGTPYCDGAHIIQCL